MRRLTTGWEASTTLSTMCESTSATTGYTQEVSTSSPRSGLNKYRVYRNAANVAYSPTASLAVNIPSADAAFSPAVTCAEPVDSSETVIDVNDASGIEVNDMILIDSELMKVTAVDTAAAPDTITVIRGRVGTTAASHSNGATILQSGEAFVYTSSGDPIAQGDLIVIDSEEMYCNTTTNHRDTTNNILRVTRAANGTTAATHAAATAINCGWTGAGAKIEYRFLESTNILHHQEIDGTTRGYIMSENSDGDRCGLRVFFNIATLPTGTHTIDLVQIQDNAGANVARVFMTNGNLGCATAGGSSLTLLASPSTATWYRLVIEIRSRSNAEHDVSFTVFEEDTNTVKGSRAQKSGAITANVVAVFLGMMPQLVVSRLSGLSDFDIAFDDLAVNDGVGNWDNYAPGYGRVRGVVVPTADLTPLQWELNATGSSVGTHYLEVDEDMSDSANWNQTPAAASITEDTYDHASAASFSVAGTITNVMVWASHADVAGEDGANHRLGIVDSSGNYLTSIVNLPIHASDAQQYFGVNIGAIGRDGIATTGTPAKWTNAEFDNAANGFFIKHTSATANQRKKLFSIRGEVEEDGGLGLANPYQPKKKMSQGHAG